MTKKSEKKEEKVLVDPRVLAAAATERPAAEEHQDSLKGAPLITGKGSAELGDIIVDFDETSEFVKFRSGGTVTKLDLYQFVFGICDSKTREQLMPVRQTEMTTITKVHVVALKKDMRKGQTMKVRCHTNIPTSVVDGLKGMR